MSARSFALANHRRHFVSSPLADHLALKLGEVHQYGTHQATYRRGGVNGLSYGNERHAMLVKNIKDMEEIFRITAEAIVLVTDHRLKFFLFRISQEPSKGWPIHIATGKAGVIVCLRVNTPPLALAALDEGLAILSLRIEGREIRI